MFGRRKTRKTERERESRGREGGKYRKRKGKKRWREQQGSKFYYVFEQKKKKEKMRDGGNAIYDGLIQEQIAEACVNIS